MKDLNYFPLDVESNIYSMTILEFEDKTNKILVATLDCRIYCIDYSRFKPHTRDVEFTYIPNGAKILSIGTLKRGQDNFAIGITHSLSPNLQKSSTRSSNSGFSSREINCEYSRLTTYYFNVYASNSAAYQFDLDQVAQGCQTIRLRYVPYHLYSTELLSFTDNGKIRRKPFWLLSGGDNCIHAFSEDKPYQTYNEIPIDECFPELNNINGLALWIDVLNIENNSNYVRLIALGFEDGSVKLFHSVLSASSNKFILIKESKFDDYTTIIPSVRLFKINSNHQSKISHITSSKESSAQVCDDINLLVVSSTNSSLVFKDILINGLNIKYELPGSQRFDSSVTSAIGDTNFDGLNELLIGTHGRELLEYHYDRDMNSYQLKDIIELNQPLFAISISDITGDALKEVIIMLVNGIILLQSSVEDAIHICKKRVDRLLSLLSSK